MTHYDARLHVQGLSLYVDDVPSPHGMLHAAVFSSPVAHGKLRSVDIQHALNVPGVHAVFLAKDIPGENQIGAIIQDEVLLAEDAVHFIGHPIALVIADSADLARHATTLIKVDIEKLPAIVCPREAYKRGHFIAPHGVNVM
jgi:xanthine dehydrogenase large subunit